MSNLCVMLSNKCSVWQYQHIQFIPARHSITHLLRGGCEVVFAQQSFDCVVVRLWLHGSVSVIVTVVV